MGHLEPEAPVAQRKDVRDRRPIPACVRDDHDIELEALGSMDREEPDRVGALLLGDRVGLLGADVLLALDEAHEPLEVGATELLVRAGETGELAEVGVAALAVRPREHGEVVVVLAQDPLAEQLEGRMGGELEQPLVPLPEGEDHPAVVLRQVSRDAALDPAEDRLPLRLGPDQHERVVRHPDERRREDGQESLVVVAVVQEAEVREQVDDLLLAEVAAPRGAVRRQPDAPQLFLEPLRVRPGGEEEDDLPRRRASGVDELADAPRDVARLRAPPVDARLGCRRLVGDEELDGVPQRGQRSRRRRVEALELVSELGGEELVDRCEHLRPRSMVLRERKDGRRGSTALAEHGDVRVPEAVDRLELVADDEEVAALGGSEQVEQLGLEAVRVLELVDHDRPEPLSLPLADLVVVPEQVACAELEVLEVERGLAVLRVRVGGGERRQELLQQLAIACRELLERGGDDGVPRLGEARGARAAHLQVTEREKPLGKRRGAEEIERRLGGVTLQRRRLHVADETRRRLPHPVDSFAERRARAGLEDEVPPRGTERRVHLDEHPPEPVGAVRRQELPAVGLVGGAETFRAPR